MIGDPPPHVRTDEAYWQSLLSDAEAHMADRPAGERRTAGRHDQVDLAWQAAQRASDTAEVIQVHSVGCNRGGLLIEWNGLRGFMPASHISGLAGHLDDDDRRGQLAQHVGDCFRARVIEIDRGQGRFVVSERLACGDHVRRDAVLAQLAEGQVRSGTITNVCDFGAFVDLGGVEGLLHISEISWGRVNQPSEFLRVGQAVNVLLLSVDCGQGRVALSIKRLEPDPWQTVAERYHVGDVVAGVVTGVVGFGAFARLPDGLEGLIHVSELAEGNFLHPRNVVQEGQPVRVRVINIDGPHRRLGLSLRQVNGQAPEISAQELA